MLYIHMEKNKHNKNIKPMLGIPKFLSFHHWQSVVTFENPSRDSFCMEKNICTNYFHIKNKNKSKRTNHSFHIFCFLDFSFLAVIILKTVPPCHIEIPHCCEVAWFSTTWMSDMFLRNVDEHWYVQYFATVNKMIINVLVLISVSLCINLSIISKKWIPECNG